LMRTGRYEGRSEKYAIKGEAGKVVGVYPVCKKKKWLCFLKTFIISLAGAGVVVPLMAKFVGG